MRDRWTIYALLFSAAVNIAAVSVLIYFWTAGPPARERALPRRGHHARLTELGLTEEQRAAFDSIRARYLRDMRPLWEELHQRRRELTDLVLSDQPDSARIRQLVDRISSLQVEMELRSLRFFRDLRGVLTPEQLRKFRRMTEERMRHRPPMFRRHSRHRMRPVE